MLSAINAKKITDAYNENAKARNEALNFCNTEMDEAIIEAAESGLTSASAKTSENTSGSAYIVHIVNFLSVNGYIVYTETTKNDAVIITAKWDKA